MLSVNRTLTIVLLPWQQYDMHNDVFNRTFLPWQLICRNSDCICVWSSNRQPLAKFRRWRLFYSKCMRSITFFDQTIMRMIFHSGWKKSKISQRVFVYFSCFLYSCDFGWRFFDMFALLNAAWALNRAENVKSRNGFYLTYFFQWN